MRVSGLAALAACCISPAFSPAFAQSMIPPPPPPDYHVPDWALPQSPTHTQVAPPPNFHRPSVTFDKPIGGFEGQTDIGGPLVPGHATYDAASKTYAITSAGYNIWYSRDEFYYLWRKMSGDVSLAASVIWPDIHAFHDRKVVLAVRQSLNDDSAEEVAAQHGDGMVHLAQRPAKGAQMHDFEYRASSYGGVPGAAPNQLVTVHPARIGIEKHGDLFQLYVSWRGEPMHPEGLPERLPIHGPFYVGIGFTSHLPATALTAKVTGVVLENAAGKVR